MCSVEMMMANAGLQLAQQSEIMELKRKQISQSYARAMGAEDMRSTIEKTKADWWRDSENRQISVQRGSDLVTQAGAGISLGVDGQLLDQKWDASQVDLHQQYTNVINQNAAMGDQRAIELKEVRDAQLEMAEGPSIMDFVLAMGTAAAQGQYMMQQAGTWQDRETIFGIPKDDWEKFTPWNWG